MTKDDLDEIRKRCEARGSDAVPDAFRDRRALLDEVERLNRIVAAPPGCSGCGVELGDSWCAKCATEAERDRLRGEVERLQRERDEAVAGRQCWKEACRKTEAEREANGEQMDRWWHETQTLRARLALLEPVWEAAKEWRLACARKDSTPDEVGGLWAVFVAAIDAAVAKEGRSANITDPAANPLTPNPDCGLLVLSPR